MFAKEVINAIQNTCIAISQKENGKYFAFFNYSGHVDNLSINICLRSDKDYTAICTERVSLNTKNSIAELQKILDKLKDFYNE